MAAVAGGAGSLHGKQAKLTAEALRRGSAQKRLAHPCIPTVMTGLDPIGIRIAASPQGEGEHLSFRRRLILMPMGLDAAIPTAPRLQKSLLPATSAPHRMAG